MGCSDCPAVVNVTFQRPAEARFMGGRASNMLKGMKFEFGVRVNPSDQLNVVAPLATLTVDATAVMEFELRQPEGRLPNLKATLVLDSFEQKVEALFIEVPIDFITRDLKAVLSNLLDKINAGVPALPIPAIAGVKLDNPSIVLDNHQLVVLADLAQASFVSQIMV